MKLIQEVCLKFPFDSDLLSSCFVCISQECKSNVALRGQAGVYGVTFSVITLGYCRTQMSMENWRHQRLAALDVIFTIFKQCGCDNITLLLVTAGDD